MPEAGLKRLSPSEPGERIWRYVVVSDTGFAPCIERRLLTLCTCKPTIRRGASRGDWVIGWTPKRLGVDRVVWIGEVERTLSMGEYCERHPKRRDAIYRRVGYSPDGRERLRHTGVEAHGKPRNWRTDASGRNALLFRKFWYWGASAPRAEPLAHLAHPYVGQTCRPVREDDLPRLVEWLAKQGPPGVYGSPRDAPSVQTDARPPLCTVAMGRTRVPTRCPARR